MTNNSIKRHSNEWEINFKAWENKSELRDAYKTIYEEISKRLTGSKILELGSGMGKSKTWIKHVTTSDREPNPWVNRVESAYKISDPDNTWDHIIMVDVFHHLERPAACLKEVHRVLKDNGSLIIVEPDISLLGWVIYGLCHKEPVGYLEKISTNPAPPTAETYYARQSSAHRVFLKKQYSELLKPLKIKEVTRLPMLYYILTGGFSGPNLAKFIKKGWVTCLENALKNFPQVSSTRLLTVLEKPSGHLNK